VRYTVPRCGVPRHSACLMVALALCIGIPAWSQQACAPNHVDVPKERARATANTVANLRSSPGSLKAELSRLLSDARKEIARAKPPSGNSCSRSCNAVGPARITVSVVPNKYLKGYADARKCEESLTRTSRHPLRFGPHHASSEKDLGSWISQVSQGHGKDGATLYQKCGGKCSPRYFIDTTRKGDGLVATMDVVCGPARDKDDDTYTVSSGYRWGCRAVSASTGSFSTASPAEGCPVTATRPG